MLKMFKRICLLGMTVSTGILAIPIQPSQAQPRLTEFGHVSQLEGDITCGRGTGGLHTYLETSAFRIYVCGDEQDPAQPRFYRSFSLDGTLGLSLSAQDYEPQQGRYLIFDNNGYEYILDGGNAQTQIAQLIVRDPQGQTILEQVATLFLTRDDGD